MYFWTLDSKSITKSNLIYTVGLSYALNSPHAIRVILHQIADTPVKRILFNWKESEATFHPNERSYRAYCLYRSEKNSQNFPRSNCVLKTIVTRG